MSKISEIAENKKHYDGITLVERMKECHTSAVSIALIENFEARHNWETIDRDLASVLFKYHTAQEIYGIEKK